MEELFDLFKCFTSGLRVGEKSLDGRTEAKASEDDEEFPGDAGEGWWDEETDCEIEEPVNSRIRVLHINNRTKVKG